MEPKKLSNEQGHLFRPRLSGCLPQEHPLLRLGRNIDWESLEHEFVKLFRPKPGRPPSPVRLMVGLLMLQHMHGLSDEKGVEQGGQNHFWQAFCGYDFLQAFAPVHPTGHCVALLQELPTEKQAPAGGGCSQETRAQEHHCRHHSDA